MLLCNWYGDAVCRKLAKNHVFLDSEQPGNQQRKAHKPSLYSDVVWLSLYTQCKFHMDLSFPSIKLSCMKFLPRSFKTKAGGVAATTPSFSFSSKLFRLVHYIVTTSNGIIFQLQMHCQNPRFLYQG